MAAVRNYSSWSLEKLRSEKARIDKVIEKREAQGRGEAIRAIKQAVRKSGLALSELVEELHGTNTDDVRGPGRPARKRKKAVSKKKARGKKARGRKAGKVAPKYRNPKDASMTWTGRGRSPVWVRDHEKKHGNRDALLIR